MPEEKIGTKVELDINELLKRLDQLNAATKKQKESWDSWLGAVERRYSTLDKVSDAIQANTNRLNELRFSAEKGTTVVKEEISVRRKLLAALNQLKRGYREQERAVGRAQKAQQRHTGSITKNLKQMLLWGIGAASAYRVFMKIRRALQETFEGLYGNTEAYKALTAATDRFKISLLSVLGTESDVLTLLDRTAAGLSKLADGFNQTVAAIRGFVAGTIMLLGDLTDTEGKTKAAARAFEVYNAVMQSYSKQVQEASEATEELSEGQKKQVQAYERYQQRLYRITETRLQGLLRAHKAYYNALADMALEDTRRAEDLAIETARRREDWARDAARRRAALLRQYNKQVLQVEMSYWRAARRLAENRIRRLLQIERRYRDRLLEIERAYSYSMYEAIAARDATAALRAMRKRREDLADAKRDRDRARADVEADYLRRLRELQENLEEQRRQARKSYEEALEELNRSLREQEEDLAISLRRREEDAELSRKRQLQDLKLSLAKQMRAVIDQYNRDRRLANIEYRYREDAFARHLARMRAIALAYQVALRPLATPTAGGSGVQRFAEGGAMVVTRPTMALFGERGTELVIAQPLPPTPQSFMVSGSVRHEVSTIIQQSMAGFEGRIAGAVHSALSEVIR